MTGVSPAYFLSRSGPGFGPADLAAGLPFLAKTGYKAFQAEVFLESALPLWTEDTTSSVAEAARVNGLGCSAFVAHFLGSVFSSGMTLSRGLPLDQAKQAISIASVLIASSTPAAASSRESSSELSNGSSSESSSTAKKTVALVGDRRAGLPFVVPVPTFAWLKSQGSRQQHDADSASRFRDILGTLLELCGNAGLRLALELLPGNILGGSAAFISLVEEPGFADLGILLDTGHFWAMGEAVQDLPRKLGSHIVATHLCDNDGIENLSLCPGNGTIPFPATLRTLAEAGYSGSLDLEIVCPKDSVESEYRRAFSQFTQLADQSCYQLDPDRITGHQTNQQHHKESI